MIAVLQVVIIVAMVGTIFFSDKVRNVIIAIKMDIRVPIIIMTIKAGVIVSEVIVAIGSKRNMVAVTNKLIIKKV